MIDMLKSFISRLFILTPLILVSVLVGLTMVVPFLLWLFFGFDYITWAIETVSEVNYFLEDKGWL